MKKKHFLWLPLFCLVACRPAHREKAASARQQARPALQQGDTLGAGISAGDLEQSQAWDEVSRQFIRECLGPFLAEKQVELDCSTCDRILFSYILRVDGRGHIIEARQSSREINCTKLKAKDLKVLDNRIQAYFQRLKLPPVLYNSTHQGPFSLLLKC